jgi:putative membrane protein
LQGADRQNEAMNTGLSSNTLIERDRDAHKTYFPAIVAGFAGGNLSSFVKWGTEIPFPPRETGRVSPPYAILEWLGLDVANMTYVFTGHVINYGVALVHQGFSVVFGLLYCLLATVFPSVTLGQGLAFGLVVTLVFHAALLPLGGWAPQVWDISAHEAGSELFGHLLWAWTIEIVRRDMTDGLRGRPA